MTEMAATQNESRSAVPTKCATCQALQQVPFACDDCHELLAHVQGADYFELFGLPRAYELDLNVLEERFLAICRNIHPDKYASAGEEMRAFALRASASVNKAYDVLRDPLHRAEYLLESMGGKSATQDKRVPQDLLGQVMLVREEIEEAKAAGDEQAMLGIREKVQTRRRDLESRIAGLCTMLTQDGEQGKDELRQQLNALKYLNKLLA